MEAKPHSYQGPFNSNDFSGGEATVIPKLQMLGFDVVRISEDWSAEEVDATVAAYSAMLHMEAQQVPYKTTDFNAALRQMLHGRSKSSVETQSRPTVRSR